MAQILRRGKVWKNHLQGLSLCVRSKSTDNCQQLQQHTKRHVQLEHFNLIRKKSMCVILFVFKSIGCYKLRFNCQRNEQLYRKTAGSLFIGSSPECELALYTLCCFVYPHQKCTVELDEEKSSVKILTLLTNEGYISTAYPVCQHRPGAHYSYTAPVASYPFLLGVCCVLLSLTMSVAIVCAVSVGE